MREATDEDADFLVDMLVEACNWSGQQRVSRTAVEADRQLRSYVSGWPREHDVGVVAIDDQASRIGAAWARTFTAGGPGYGYVADDVPEISMAVDPRWRGQGVGRRLLRTLIEMAQARGWRAISLSVEDGNRARELYLAAGFTTAGRSGTSETMVLDLQRDVSTSRCVRSQRRGGRMDERIEEARLSYERAVFGGDSSRLPAAERALDGVEADLALARGRILHARFLETRVADADELALFERVAHLRRGLGDVAGEGEALFWIGTFHQLVSGDHDAAVHSLLTARDLATRAGDALTLSYVLRHLGIADHAAGRLDAARGLLEESTRLRREAGFLPGVAANLVGLAYIAAAQDRHGDARDLLDEATQLADESGAAGILRSIDEARTQLGEDIARP